MNSIYIRLVVRIRFFIMTTKASTGSSLTIEKPWKKVGSASVLMSCVKTWLNRLQIFIQDPLLRYGLDDNSSDGGDNDRDLREFNHAETMIKAGCQMVLHLHRLHSLSAHLSTFEVTQSTSTQIFPATNPSGDPMTIYRANVSALKR